MKNEVIICLDIGGTNVRMGLVDQAHRLLDARFILTEEITARGFLPGLTEALKQYRVEAEKEYTVAAVSLGVPATVDKARRVVVQAPNVPGLDNCPIAEILEKALNLPVFLEKDVNLLLTYDLQSLALPEEGLIIGIYFGTGIGNAISWNGQLLVGKNGVAGELGHIPQLGSRDICGCGNVGCMEPIGGGRRLSQLCKSVFRNIDVAELYACYADTPEVLAQVDAMAATVATEVNILDPDYVIIGGGLPQMKGFPMETFLHRIRVHTRKPMPLEGLQIRFARPNQNNGIIGAGIYGWKKLRQCRRPADG